MPEKINNPFDSLKPENFPRGPSESEAPSSPVTPPGTEKKEESKEVLSPVPEKKKTALEETAQEHQEKLEKAGERREKRRERKPRQDKESDKVRVQDTTVSAAPAEPSPVPESRPRRFVPGAKRGPL